MVDEFLHGPTAPQSFHMAGLLQQVQHIENQNVQTIHQPGNVHDNINQCNCVCIHTYKII